MPMAMDSSTEAAGESHLSCTASHSHMATGGGFCGASPPPLVVSARDALDESVYEGSEAPPPPLSADVPADILGTVLGFLPCLADRASVRSVCRHWRAAARVQAALPAPAPLPVLVLPRFRFSCLTSDGLLTVPRRALMPVEAAGDDVRIVGSCDDWLMASRPTSRHAKETGGECFLVHAFSSDVVHLPRLQQNTSNYSCLDESKSSSARPVGRFFHGAKKSWLLCSAVLSASPSSGSKYIVAALSYHGAAPGLALWQPGMTSWHRCRSAAANNSLKGDLAFYQGKLYMVLKHTPDIFAFEIREDEQGVNLSCPQHYAINPLIPSRTMGSSSMRCNLAVWRGKLLLIIRFFSDQFRNVKCELGDNVEVLALDFSTSPCGVNQIHNFDGDCIFVQKSGCRSFSAGLYVGVQGDLIYFLDESIINHVSYTSVHNMRDGTVRRFAASLPLANSRVPEERYLDFPVWFFPSS